MLNHSAANENKPIETPPPLAEKPPPAAPAYTPCTEHLRPGPAYTPYTEKPAQPDSAYEPYKGM